MVLQAPNFDQIQLESGFFTRDGIRTTWQTMLQGVTQDLPVAIQVAKDLLEPKVKSDAPGSQQDNYQLGRASVLLLTGSTSFSLTGIKAPDPGKARLVIVVNTGTGTLTMKNESTSSLASNRIHTKTGSDVTLATDATSILIYLSSRYRQVV